MNDSRIAVLCPGRGSYTAQQLGSLAALDDDARFVEIARLIGREDTKRSARGDTAIRDLDAATKFSSRLLRGENAAPLIYSVTLMDWLRLDPARVEVVALGGNSMGWYSALACAGALDPEAGMRLVDTMGSMTRDGAIGGQVIYPLVDDAWVADSARTATVERALMATRASAQAGLSICFGGFAVLWGDSAGVKRLSAELPEVTLGKQTYPMQLFGNSAFHSLLMREAAERGAEQLAELPWGPPATPLVDGRGVAWRSLSTDLVGLADYTLGHQVTETYDFAASVRVILREYAPDRIVVLGPGESLGGAVAHTLIAEGWQGIDCREAFLERQRDDPVVVSMSRPEQRALVAFSS